MSPSFRLGFFTHVEGKGEPATLYEDTLRLFEAAEHFGFDVGWVAQHHFHIHPGRLPSPFPFLAAAAQRTRRLRLGTSIVTMPLELPLRVAEDAAVVDALSGGRLELGVGSGGEPGEFQAFGLDMTQRREMTTTGVETLRCALRGDPLNDTDLRLDPPAPTLLARLWQSAVAEGGARYIAAQGTGLMLARAAWHEGRLTEELQLPVAQAYFDAFDPQHGQPRFALSRAIHLAANRRVALAELQPEVMRTADKMIGLGQWPAGLTLEDYCRYLHLSYGDPDDVAESLAADTVIPLTHDLILQFNPIIPPVDQAIRMLEQLATQVAPQLGWRPQPATVA